MKTSFVHVLALAFMAWPVLGPAQTRVACDADPLTCLSDEIMRVEENGASEANILALRVAQVGALARSGGINPAGEIADGLERPRDVVPAQLALAEALVVAGQNAEAASAISEALVAANRTQYPALKLDMLADIARMQMLAGDVEGASASLAPVMAALEAMPAGFSRNALIIRAIKSGVLFQDIGAAQTLTYSIDSAYDWDQPILEIARFFVREGQPNLALEELLKIENPVIRLSALTTFLIEFPDVGQPDDAQDAINNATLAAYKDGTPTVRAFAMIRAIKALAILGDASVARQVSPAISQAQRGMSRTSYTGFIIELSDYYSISGQQERAVGALEAALRTAEKIDDENMRVGPIGEVVAALARLGATGRAFEIVSAEQNADTQVLWLIILADELG